VEEVEEQHWERNNLPFQTSNQFKLLETDQLCKMHSTWPLAEQISVAPRALQNCWTARELVCFSSSMVTNSDVALTPRLCRWWICDATSDACQHCSSQCWQSTNLKKTVREISNKAKKYSYLYAFTWVEKSTMSLYFYFISQMFWLPFVPSS